jgi:hypothetical protein
VGVMPRPGRELAEAHRPQLPAQSRTPPKTLVESATG